MAKPKKPEVKKKNPIPREPFLYTEEMAIRICKAIATSYDGLRKICKNNPDFPSYTIVYEWKIANPAFADMYATAKRHQADILAEEILDIADDSFNDYTEQDGIQKVNIEHISRSRLRIDTRKWLAAKLIPRIYGDKLVEETDDKINTLREQVNEMRDIAQKCMKTP